MSWILVVAIEVLAFAVFVVVFRLPRPLWAMTGAALAVGLAGYAAQARPGLAGAPKDAQLRENRAGEELVKLRKAFTEGKPGSNALIVSDAFARRGDFGNATTALRGEIRENPDNSEAWVALANNLVAHADGVITPPARYAFEMAAKSDPKAPAPDFFLGMAELGQGNLVETHRHWKHALELAPDDAPYRDLLGLRVSQLEKLMRAIAEQRP
ncbi:MAG: cytochrome C biosynthesis protein [Caenibius sp.]